MSVTLHWYDGGTIPAAAFPAHEAAVMQKALCGQPAAGVVRLARCALIGAHEDPARALRRSYVDGRFPVIRRRTGGGSLSLDPGSLCLVAAFPRPDHPGRRIAWWVRCVADSLIGALATLGVACRFDAPNDIVCDERKCASVFVALEPNVVLCEAVLPVTLDIEELLKTLRLPLEKLSAAGLQAARGRFAPLGELIPAIDPDALPAALATALSSLAKGPARRVEPPTTTALPPPALQTAESSDLAAFLKTPGGVLYLDLWLDSDHAIRRARWSGAIQGADSALFARMSASLVGRPVAAAEAALAACLETTPDLLHIEREDLVYLGRLAAGRYWLGERLGLDHANHITVFSPHRGQDIEALLADIDTILLPYCAKPAWCKWRHRDGCPECGRCAVGDAYGLARERGLQVTTITNYEHLRAVLSALVAQGTRAFLGVCCTDFFLKRDYAFIEAGIAALFLDIGGETCYALRAEEDAYAGRFTAEAVMDATLFGQVLDLRDRVRDHKSAPRHLPDRRKHARSAIKH